MPAPVGVPYLGICLGMQIAVIEFARHVAGLTGAHSAEFDESPPYPVVALMEDQIHITAKGGTMRLGKYPCVLEENSRSYRLYGEKEISSATAIVMNSTMNSVRFSRKGHAVGRPISGSPSGRNLELLNHPWFVGCQFHPEFKSRPDRPHPLFFGFVEAALAHQNAQ